MNELSPVEVLSMQRIVLSDKDAEHIRDWQRLSDEEREAMNKVAKILGNEDKRKSFYALLEAQVEISNLLAVANHFNWASRMILKAGAIAAVVLTAASVWKLFFGK